MARPRGSRQLDGRVRGGAETIIMSLVSYPVQTKIQSINKVEKTAQIIYDLTPINHLAIDYCAKPIVWNNDKKQYKDKHDAQWIKHKCKTEYRAGHTKLLSSLSSSIEFTTASQLLLDNDIASLLNRDIEFANKYCKSFQFELVIIYAGKNIIRNSVASNEGDTKK